MIFESQEDAVDGILNGKVKEGDAVIIRYEGPKGGPGMQEMLYPTSYLKSMLLDKNALSSLTEGFQAEQQACRSDMFPEAASGGEIALINDGDIIEIDVTKEK